jgi:hypothetical protein
MKTTVTVNDALAVFPDPSLAVQFTVVVPIGNVEAEGGVHSMVGGLPLLSAAETE